MLTTAVIKRFLAELARSDLAKLYHIGMEAQVNCSRGNGDPVPGKRFTYRKGKDVWKSFRIPWGTKTGEVKYTDRDLTFHPNHFEAIGMTGWDWQSKRSRWVGFDFDSIRSHTVGLTDEKLAQIEKAIRAIPWVTIRRSTSGVGYHLYVFIKDSPEVTSHKEHAAVGRSILGVMSSLVNMHLCDDVDKIGQILWVWHINQKKRGYELVKQGTALDSIPQNWQDHIAVVSKKTKHTRFRGPDDPTEVVVATNSLPLTTRHHQLLGWFANCTERPVWWWDADRGCLLCHTHALLKAHQALGLKGVFTTVSTDEEWSSNTQNCFLFPMADGWQVFRHSKGVKETPIWDLTSAGWTTVRFDVPVDFHRACRMHNATRGKGGNTYHFRTLMEASQSLQLLGGGVAPAPCLLIRPATLELAGEDIAVACKKTASDPDFIEGWFPVARRWEAVSTHTAKPKEKEAPDDDIRFLIVGDKSAGWVFKGAHHGWINHGREDIKTIMAARGMVAKDVTGMMATCIIQAWRLVNLPFQDEYPGSRQWNREAAQLAYDPVQGEHPTWDLMLAHLGRTLDETISYDKWCKQYHITSGHEYLLNWIRFLLRRPETSLPYLFLYSRKQVTGKSKLHEAIKLLIAGKNVYMHAKQALISKGDFNGELSRAVLCAVEEINLGVHGAARAYNKMKDMVTSPEFLVHPKGCTPYMQANYTHWIQTANSRHFCPVFPGDSRITMVHVLPIEGEEIHADEFMQRLADEGPAFTWTLLKGVMPPPAGRLALPSLDTPDKLEAMESATDDVTIFIENMTYETTGGYMTVEDAFQNFLRLGLRPGDDPKFWKMRRFMASLPEYIDRGKIGKKWCIANRSLTPSATIAPRLVRVRDQLMTAVEARAYRMRELEDGVR